MRLRRRVVLRRRVQIAIGIGFLALSECFLIIMVTTFGFNLRYVAPRYFIVVFAALALVNLRVLIGQARLAVIVDEDKITIRNWWRTIRVPLAAFDHTDVSGSPPRVKVMDSPTSYRGIRCGAISAMTRFQRASKVEAWAGRLDAAVAAFRANDDDAIAMVSMGSRQRVRPSRQTRARSRVSRGWRPTAVDD